MKHEEKARQETEAGQAGEETCALRRGAQEGVEREEKEEVIKISAAMVSAGVRALRASGLLAVESSGDPHLVREILVAALARYSRAKKNCANQDCREKSRASMYLAKPEKN